MQYLDRHLTDLAIDEAYGNAAEDEDEKTPKGTLNAANLHKYLSKLLYSRRNSFDPLWNQILVGGLDSEGEPFLASVDLRGTTFTAPSLATGFGAALAQPIMRKAIARVSATGADDAGESNLSRDEAIAVVRECMKVLFYRDARSMDGYSLAVITAAGVELSENEVLEQQSWAFAERIKGYGTQTV
jgi:20S proteasome subunit beta 7